MPARHRLPDPPHPFVGRSDEVRWLAAAIERAPVATVWGPGGIGKTALAVHTIVETQPARAATALRISLRGRDPGRDVYLEILQALAQTRQLTRLDWAGLAGDVDGLTAAVIDLAEAGPHLVLLDDVHHADRAQVRDLLLQLARYAGDSRWIAVGRDELVVAELPGQVLRLGPMRDSELREVATGLAPELDDDEIRTAVGRAGGSPWTLQQVLGATPAGGGSGVQGLLGDLPDGAVELLTTLALLDVPVDPRLLRDVAPEAGDDELERLARRGLVERSEARVEVHDVVRDELRARAEAAAGRVERVARTLAESGENTPVIEAVRMLADTGAVDALGDLLDAHGQRLLDAGEAPRLWPHLEATGAARLRRWKLRCALEVGDMRVLKAATEPEGDELVDRLVWARVLWARRQLADALAEARAVAEATDDAGVRHEATLLAARSLVHLGRFEEAADALAAHRPGEGEAELRTEALRAHCLRLLGRLEEATARVHELLEPVLAMTGPAREESAFTLAHAAFELGLLPEARQLVARLARPEEGWAPALHEGRQALMLHAGIAILEGELPAAEDALDRLEPYVQRTSHLRARLRLARCMLRGLSGQLEGHEEALTAAIQDARQVSHPDALALASALSSQWAAMNALPAPAPEQLLATDELGAARPDLARYAVLARAHREARSSTSPGTDVEPTPEDVHAGLGGLRLLVDAQRALVAGESDRAVAAARAAVRVCRETRHAARELEARHALCEMLLGARDFQGLGEAAAELLALATRCTSGRMADEARFFRLVSTGGLAPSTLEPLAARERVAPAAARRCQSLLGGSPRLDAIDHTLLEVMRAMPGHVPVTTVQDLPDDVPWEPGWGLDERHGTLWLEDGTTLDLSHRRLLFRLLTALADHGGETDKERLVLAVWEEAEYHPLHHDNRLHSAVRKLRKLVEPNPTSPRRLLTTEAGYALAPPTRRVQG